MPLSDHDKFTLNLARELLPRVGCPASDVYGEGGVQECCCTGACTSPLALELEALIARGTAAWHAPPEGPNYGSWLQGGYVWPVGWPVGYHGPRG